MGEGGLVLLGEEPMALEYVEYSRQLYIGLFLAVQGFQGENGEGISYWSYGGNFLKLYGEMMKNACGIDLFKHAWLGKTIRIRTAGKRAQADNSDVFMMTAISHICQVKPVIQL